jgi:hypothetical protein
MPLNILWLSMTLIIFSGGFLMKEKAEFYKFKINWLYNYNLILPQPQLEAQI